MGNIMTEYEIQKKLYERASHVKNINDFCSFLEDIEHSNYDFSFSVYAALAIMRSAHNLIAKKFPLTISQASWIGVELLKYFGSIQGPIKILEWKNMLYPQYEEKFDKIITKDIFQILRFYAKNELEKEQGLPHIREHWKSIVAGKVPFGYEIKE